MRYDRSFTIQSQSIHRVHHHIMSMHATVHLPMDGCGTWPPDPLPRACPPYPPCPPPYLRRDPVDHCQLLVLGHAPACDHAVVKEENICMLYRGTISIGYIIICSLNICLMILYVILSSFAGYLPGACFLSCACMAEHPRCCHVMRGASGPRPTLGFGKGGGGVGGGPSEQLRSDAMQQRTMSGKGVGGVTDSRRIRFRNYVRVRKVAQSPTPLETLRTHRIVSHCSKSLAARASSRVGTLSPCRWPNRRDYASAPADAASNAGDRGHAINAQYSDFRGRE